MPDFELFPPDRDVALSLGEAVGGGRFCGPQTQHICDLFSGSRGAGRSKTHAHDSDVTSHKEVWAPLSLAGGIPEKTLQGLGDPRRMVVASRVARGSRGDDAGHHVAVRVLRFARALH